MNASSTEPWNKTALEDLEVASWREADALCATTPGVYEADNRVAALRSALGYALAAPVAARPAALQRIMPSSSDTGMNAPDSPPTELEAIAPPSSFALRQ